MPWQYQPSKGTVLSGDSVEETIRAKYIVNAAGCTSDKIARMIGDDSFKVKPRYGEYILLHLLHLHFEHQKIRHALVKRITASREY